MQNRDTHTISTETSSTPSTGLDGHVGDVFGGLCDPTGECEVILTRVSHETTPSHDHCKIGRTPWPRRLHGGPQRSAVIGLIVGHGRPAIEIDLARFPCYLYGAVRR
ncbi:MAG: hypothetical protein GX880_07610 [Methanomicrobiales archaeon]|nr:hypothetical protein [Methanomicrobiales archaeon]